MVERPNSGSNRMQTRYEAKIEIMAKPAGKRPQSIDLLSAGQKTLTAIALLSRFIFVKKAEPVLYPGRGGRAAGR